MGVKLPANDSLPFQSKVLAFDLALVDVPLPTISTYVPRAVAAFEDGSDALYSPKTCCDLWFAIVYVPLADEFVPDAVVLLPSAWDALPDAIVVLPSAWDALPVGEVEVPSAVAFVPAVTPDFNPFLIYPDELPVPPYAAEIMSPCQVFTYNLGNSDIAVLPSPITACLSAKL